jgi:hypothetical protein
MKLKASLFGLFLFSLNCVAETAPAADPAFTHGVTMLGAGGQTCAEYNAHRDKSFSHVMDMHWIAGFISAYSLIHDIQYTALSADDFFARFDQYCQKPNYANTAMSNVAHAMMYDLDIELGVPSDFGNDFKEINKEVKSQ